MTTNPQDMACRYKAAERLVWQKLSDWRKQAILDARTSHSIDSHVLNDFAKEIIHMAESPDFFDSASMTLSDKELVGCDNHN